MSIMIEDLSDIEIESVNGGVIPLGFVDKA
jgi:lactobin A/cerein 7B family class IIb bacteriocin